MEKLPPHKLTPEAAKYVAAMTDKQKQLHALAIEKLGSSYFVDKTKGFQDYSKSNAKK
jgi:hypothetical protein